MPQKHSKNNGSSTYGVFSYGERKQCSFMSSIDERTGADDDNLRVLLKARLRSLAMQPVLLPFAHLLLPPFRRV